MPVPFYEPIVCHDYTAPPSPAVRSKCPAAPTPRRKAAPSRKKPRPKKRAAKKPKKPAAKLSPQCASIIDDRIEAAIEAGLIVVCDEDMPCEALDVTIAELALWQRILNPEAYADPSEGRKPAKASGTAPGSADRIAEYAFRVAQRRTVTVKGDATAHGAHDRGLKVVQRANGSGVKVVGWAEEG